MRMYMGPEMKVHVVSKMSVHTGADGSVYMEPDEIVDLLTNKII
jgi:hypothetical protein